MTFSEKWETWSEFKRNLIILLLVALFGAVICVPFIFLDNVGVLLGWLLGSAVNIVAYVSNAKGSAMLLKNAESGKVAFAVVFAFLRLLLYFGALALAAAASFLWGTLAHGYCNFISTALALMPTWIMLAIVTLHRNKKGAR